MRKLKKGNPRLAQKIILDEQFKKENSLYRYWIKYINELKHKFKLVSIEHLKRYKSKIYNVHDKIKNIKESELVHVDRNPYQMFQDWLLEIVQYGSIITFAICVMFGFKGILSFILITLATGVLRWLWLDFVKETSNSMRKQ